MLKYLIIIINTKVLKETKISKNMYFDKVFDKTEPQVMATYMAVEKIPGGYTNFSPQLLQKFDR